VTPTNCACSTRRTVGDARPARDLNNMCVTRLLYTCIVCVTTPLYGYHLCHDPFIRVSFVSRPLYTCTICVTTPSCLIHMNMHEYQKVKCDATSLYEYHVGHDPFMPHTHEYQRVMCVATPVLHMSRMSTYMKESCGLRSL